MQVNHLSTVGSDPAQRRAMDRPCPCVCLDGAREIQSRSAPRAPPYLMLYILRVG
jgi:hypothetical protein